MSSRVAVIGNPRAGKGRGARAIAFVVGALRKDGLEVEVMPTQRPRHAVELAERAATGGFDLLLAVGGDGTLHEVAWGMLASGADPEQVAVAPVPAGTCNSFCRDFGLAWPRLDQSVRLVTTGARRRVDAARITYGPRDETGYFVNVFGTGFMAQVADTANKRFRFLGGQSYNAAVFASLISLDAPRTRLEVMDENGSAVIEDRFTLVGLSNNQWTGDGMWIAPRANVSDGKLDLLTLSSISRLELVKLFPRIFNGTHLTHPAIKAATARRVTIVPSKPSPLLADGEVFGTTPVTVEVLPGALSMAV